MSRSAKSQNKQPAKRSVVCPHCGGRQKESVYARSTICVACGRYFDIAGGVEAAQHKPRIVVREREETQSGTPRLIGALTGVLTGMLSSRRGSRPVVCYECGARSEASRAAQSTACPKCGAYMDLQDVIVERSVSRVICTQGDLRVTAKGTLASTRALVGNALVEGSVEGTLIARDCILVKRVGLVRGILHAREIDFAKKCRVKLLNSTHASKVEIHGDVEGEIHASGSVIVHKHGRLAGRVFARGFRVDKGGEFHGSLQIGGVIPPERPDDLFESAEKKTERFNSQATFVERPA